MNQIKHRAITTKVVLVTILLATSCQPEVDKKQLPHRIYENANMTDSGFLRPLSPQESMDAVELPRGYSLELVASEPMVIHPVDITWDGNGCMYVAEMHTYMNDIEGNGTDVPRSRVSRLEDTDDDGKMDKHTVFIDSLMLPRMLLTVGNKLIVNETYTHDLWSYEDTDDDGVADHKELIYDSNKTDRRNLEHQNSGLHWNLDNWLYVSRDPVRYKYRKGKIEVDEFELNPEGQWGLTSNDYGRLFFSFAGMRIPALGFQINPKYGRLDFEDQYPEDFDVVWPIVATPENNGRTREDKSLSQFASGCGQVIFRGDRLPEDMYGDYLICEPVGRLIRRAEVSYDKGKATMRNIYKEQEFLASKDMYFRPVYLKTAPDGTMYIVDMYHGIIQESQWVKEGSGIYKNIKKLGLDNYQEQGRIYRLVHEDHKRGPQPKMLDEPSEQLAAYLSHPNGWWRETAQKELIVRDDHSIVLILTDIALNGPTTEESDSRPDLARIHALWALEGMGVMNKEILFKTLGDEDPHVRRTSIWISEMYLGGGDEEILNELGKLKDDPSPEVRVQLALSLSLYKEQPKVEELYTYMLGKNKDNEVITASEAGAQAEAMEQKRIDNLWRRMDPGGRHLVNDGIEIFEQVCSACHGPRGQGKGGMFPNLRTSERVLEEPEKLIRILLHGLTGPIDGEQYSELMPAMGMNDDKWIASVITYMRKDYGNIRVSIKPEEVKAIREKYEGNRLPWTLKELENEVE